MHKLTCPERRAGHILQSITEHLFQKHLQGKREALARSLHKFSTAMPPSSARDGVAQFGLKKLVEAPKKDQE